MVSETTTFSLFVTCIISPLPPPQVAETRSPLRNENGLDVDVPSAGTLNVVPPIINVAHPVLAIAAEAGPNANIRDADMRARQTNPDK